MESPDPKGISALYSREPVVEGRGPPSPGNRVRETLFWPPGRRPSRWCRLPRKWEGEALPNPDFHRRMGSTGVSPSPQYPNLARICIFIRSGVPNRRGDSWVVEGGSGERRKPQATFLVRTWRFGALPRQPGHPSFAVRFLRDFSWRARLRWLLRGLTT